MEDRIGLDDLVFASFPGGAMYEQWLAAQTGIPPKSPISAFWRGDRTCTGVRWGETGSILLPATFITWLGSQGLMAELAGTLPKRLYDSTQGYETDPRVRGVRAC